MNVYKRKVLRMYGNPKEYVVNINLDCRRREEAKTFRYSRTVFQMMT